MYLGGLEKAQGLTKIIITFLKMSSFLYTILYILTWLLPITYILSSKGDFVRRADPKGRADRTKGLEVQGGTMSKDQKQHFLIPVETVDNLIETFEWILSSLSFWKLKEDFPCNLIARKSADYYYELRKFRNENLKDTKNTKKIKRE